MNSNPLLEVVVSQWEGVCLKSDRTCERHKCARLLLRLPVYDVLYSNGQWFVLVPQRRMKQISVYQCVRTQNTAAHTLQRSFHPRPESWTTLISTQSFKAHLWLIKVDRGDVTQSSHTRWMQPQGCIKYEINASIEAFHGSCLVESAPASAALRFKWFYGGLIQHEADWTCRADRWSQPHFSTMSSVWTNTKDAFTIRETFTLKQQQQDYSCEVWALLVSLQSTDRCRSEDRDVTLL